MLRNYISNRTSGLLFCRPNGLQVLQRTVLKMSLHRILDNPELEKGGFNIFRRFRITHLKTSECSDFCSTSGADMLRRMCPNAIQNCSRTANFGSSGQRKSAWDSPYQRPQVAYAGGPGMEIAVESNDELENLRQRLRRMPDAELIRFGKAARSLCRDPRCPDYVQAAVGRSASGVAAPASTYALESPDRVSNSCRPSACECDRFLILSHAFRRPGKLPAFASPQSPQGRGRKFQ